MRWMDKIVMYLRDDENEPTNNWNIGLWRFTLHKIKVNNIHILKE